MSLSAILIPLAVSILVTAADSKKTIRKKCSQSNTSQEPILSRFNDSSLLQKTLEEHGISVGKVSDNYLTASFLGGQIAYYRQSADEPFCIDLKEIDCLDDLLNELDQIDTEYDNNVQTYTYERVMKNLPEGMLVESEEVLDDNSIVITLTVD